MASELTIEKLEEEKVELKQVLSEFQELKKCLDPGRQNGKLSLRKDTSMHQLLEGFITIY